MIFSGLPLRMEDRRVESCPGRNRSSSPLPRSPVLSQAPVAVGRLSWGWVRPLFVPGSWGLKFVGHRYWYGETGGEVQKVLGRCFVD